MNSKCKDLLKTAGESKWREESKGPASLVEDVSDKSEAFLSRVEHVSDKLEGLINLVGNVSSIVSFLSTVSSLNMSAHFLMFSHALSLDDDDDDDWCPWKLTVSSRKSAT